MWLIEYLVLCATEYEMSRVTVLFEATSSFVSTVKVSALIHQGSQTLARVPPKRRWWLPCPCHCSFLLAVLETWDWLLRLSYAFLTWIFGYIFMFDHKKLIKCWNLHSLPQVKTLEKENLLLENLTKAKKHFML